MFKLANQIKAQRLSSPFIKFVFIYYRDFPSAGHSLTTQNTQGWAGVISTSQGLQLCVSRGGLEPKCLGHHLLSVAITRS